MIVRPAGEPRLNLWGFVGGIVIHDDMDIEPFGDLSIDLFGEVRELSRPMTLVAFADDEPRGDIECGKQRGKGAKKLPMRFDLVASIRSGRSHDQRPLVQERGDLLPVGWNLH